MVELGLVLLDLCPGPLVLFVDPRLQEDSEQMVSRARTMVAKFDAAQVRRWRIMVTVRTSFVHRFPLCGTDMADLGSCLRRKMVSVLLESLLTGTAFKRTCRWYRALRMPLRVSRRVREW